ncbi:MAG: sulfotransferase [Humidesulfovibrio sp.]|jgi:sulfotransferase|uniref:sulfotransferase family protein n=1 Tax=Humidesulfovibrio sp. TaxID=2910988 RepID=UPI0027360765|nr:sulfotransferase [Humidesulfovibrio sp.]MDP2848188.1 sulfotransferase [Humidesulfovibrio sp.]
MIFNIHFISGLPRSGSTLLCALLRQNPRFTAAMTSPVASLCTAMHEGMCGGEFGVFFDDARRKTMLKGVFDSYYGEDATGRVIFDTNRVWTARMALLDTMYPGARIICCVRDVAWIIDSVERMLQKNPLQLSRIFDYQPGNSIYARAETLMNADSGLIGRALSALREAWFGDFASRLIVVPYDTLAREPKQTLERLYAELGETPFEHNLNKVIYDEPDFDANLGMPGLHKVREKVEYRERQSVLPPDISARLAPANFWQQPELNVRGVTIL